MNARKSHSLPPDIPPSVTLEQAISLLQRQINEGKSLLSNNFLEDIEFDAWESKTKDFLIRSFGSLSHHVNDVINIGKFVAFSTGQSEQYWENRRREYLTAKVRMLESKVEVLETNIELEKQNPNPKNDQRKADSYCRSVFIVHGHDDSLIHELARFISSLDLKAVVLREQANQGRTIIEKFEDYSNVGFSIILLTPDDIGGEKNIPFDQLKPRARQNVILELGYFLGKLGRKNVCSLYFEGVDIPSDYSGVVFIPVDKGSSWKYELAREIKASGINIDLNKII